jgi:hypothetical protein
VNTVAKKTVRAVSLLIVCLLIIPALPAQPCETSAQPADNCCCCCCQNSGSFSPEDDAPKHDCPCQMAEEQPKENSPAVISSNHLSSPETSLLTSEVEGPFEDLQIRLSDSSPHTLFLPSRDQPLYILNSSFLI